MKKTFLISIVILDYGIPLDRGQLITYTVGSGMVPERVAASRSVSRRRNHRRLTENLQGRHHGSLYLLQESAGVRCFLTGIVGTYSLSGTAKRQGAKEPSCLGRCDKGGNHMFSKTDFWIGLAVGAVAGIFGYRFMQERTQQLAALEAGQAELSLAELQRQKEELEDLIAAQSAVEK